MSVTGVDIRTWRLGRGLTQQEMAQVLGVRQSTVSRWESEMFSPAARHVARFEKILKEETGGRSS